MQHGSNCDSHSSQDSQRKEPTSDEKARESSSDSDTKDNSPYEWTSMVSNNNNRSSLLGSLSHGSQSVTLFGRIELTLTLAVSGCHWHLSTLVFLSEDELFYMGQKSTTSKHTGDNCYKIILGKIKQANMSIRKC